MDFMHILSVTVFFLGFAIFLAATLDWFFRNTVPLQIPGIGGDSPKAKAFLDSSLLVVIFAAVFILLVKLLMEITDNRLLVSVIGLAVMALLARTQFASSGTGTVQSGLTLQTVTKQSKWFRTTLVIFALAVMGGVIVNIVARPVGEILRTAEGMKGTVFWQLYLAIRSGVFWAAMAFAVLAPIRGPLGISWRVVLSIAVFALAGRVLYALMVMPVSGSSLDGETLRLIYRSVSGATLWFCISFGASLGFHKNGLTGFGTGVKIAGLVFLLVLPIELGNAAAPDVFRFGIVSIYLPFVYTAIFLAILLHLQQKKVVSVERVILASIFYLLLVSTISNGFQIFLRESRYFYWFTSYPVKTATMISLMWPLLRFVTK